MTYFLKQAFAEVTEEDKATKTFKIAVGLIKEASRESFLLTSLKRAKGLPEGAQEALEAVHTSKPKITYTGTRAAVVAKAPVAQKPRKKKTLTRMEALNRELRIIAERNKAKK